LAVSPGRSACRRLWRRSCHVGCRPFGGVSPAAAVAELRRVLERLGVPQADTYGTHALRRGHAQDLLEKGACLGEILRAGEWRCGWLRVARSVAMLGVLARSAAFMEYVDHDSLEAGVVLEAHLDGSGSD